VRLDILNDSQMIETKCVILNDMAERRNSNPRYGFENGISSPNPPFLSHSLYRSEG